MNKPNEFEDVYLIVYETYTSVWNKITNKL